MSVEIFFPFIFFFAYFFISLIYSTLYKSDHILDFLLSYKAFVYFLIIFFSLNKEMGTKKGFLYFYYMLLAFFFLKYTLSVGLSLNIRPVVYRENNFELLFVVLLFYLRHILVGRVKGVEWFIMTAILLLSLSRSAIPLYLIVTCAIIFERLSIKKIIIFMPFIFVLVFSFILILLNRPGGGLENIDRLVFLQVYMSEIQNMSLMNFLFGVERISPLSPESCQRLGFYKELFSYNNDGTCYSVILHSFVLRALYDHGFIMFIIILYVTYYLLRRARYSFRESFVVVLVVCLNGLSVSSFNSYFFPLIMIIYLGFSHLRQTPEIVSYGVELPLITQR